MKTVFKKGIDKSEKCGIMIVQTTKTHSFQRGWPDSKAALSDKERYGEISDRKRDSARQICAGFPQGNSQTEEVSKKGEANGTRIGKRQSGAALHVGTYHSADAEDP